MALTCPRCGTAVPSEAMYCPYCSLPKPKRGFAGAETKPEQPRPQPPRQSFAVKRSKKKDIKLPKPRTGFNKTSDGSSRKQPRGFRASVLSVAAVVTLLGVGAYIFIVPMVFSEHAEPKTVLAALDKLRKAPSNEPGLTIDGALTRELETVRRVGNLVAYQGWIVRPIKGTTTKVVLVFSYEEAGNTSQNAEWIADLKSGTFTPQTELAEKVSSPQS